jgi:Ras family protein T1
MRNQSRIAACCRPTVEQELKKADAIIITYATDRQETFSRLRSHWLPEIRRLKLKAPICLVGCKQDLRTDRQPALEQVSSPVSWAQIVRSLTGHVA